MNEFNFIGKAINAPELITSESGNDYAKLLVSVKKNFKSKDGKFDYETFQVTMFKNLADEVINDVKEGSLLMIKGRISANNYPKEDKTFYNCSLVAERLEVIEKSE